jgi:pantetheine-phosphate adenylyltransferase
MNIGIYPGSFNPWHKGHADVLLKALKVFDKVMIIKMMNPDKGITELEFRRELRDLATIVKSTISADLISRIHVHGSSDTLVEVCKSRYYINGAKLPANAIIRGLRNGNDLQYEMNAQYWNEDLGVEIPFVSFITDRTLAHVSSSGIRTVEKLGLKHNY